MHKYLHVFPFTLLFVTAIVVSFGSRASGSASWVALASTPTPQPFCGLTYNVKSWGAVGLGPYYATQDSAGINAAIAAALVGPPSPLPTHAASMGANCVLIPAGNYWLAPDSPIVVPKNFGPALTIEGEGSDTIINFGAAMDALQIGSSPQPVSGSGSEITVHDMQFNCYGAGAGGSSPCPIASAGPYAGIHIWGKNFTNYRFWDLDMNGFMPYCFFDQDTGAGSEQSAHDLTSVICSAATYAGGYSNSPVNLAFDHFWGQTYGFAIDGAAAESHVDNAVFYGEAPFVVMNQGVSAGSGSIHMSHDEMNNIGVGGGMTANNQTGIYPPMGVCSMWLGAAGAVDIEGIDAHNGIVAATSPGPQNTPSPGSSFQETMEVKILGSSVEIGKPASPSPSPSPYSTGDFEQCSTGAIEVQESGETNITGNHITVAGGYTNGVGILLDLNAQENNVTGNVIDTAQGPTSLYAIEDNAATPSPSGVRDVIVGNSIQNNFSTSILAPTGTYGAILGLNGPS